MTKNIDSRKIEIVKQIALIDSVKMIEAIENYIQNVQFYDEFEEIFSPMKKNITVEALIEEQNYQNIDRKKFNQLVEELNIEESLEDLLLILD